MSEIRYRLRNGTALAGYLREIQRSHFFSKDGFWWSGKGIAYIQRDEWVGYKDKNNTFIFEWDILYYKMDPDAPSKRGVVLWQKKSKCFGILDLDDLDVFIPFEMNGVTLFNPRQFEVFSHLYLNPDLMELLGLEDE